MLQKCQTSSQDDTVELCGNLLSFYLNGKSHFLFTSCIELVSDLPCFCST